MSVCATPPIMFLWLPSPVPRVTTNLTCKSEVSCAYFWILDKWNHTLFVCVWFVCRLSVTVSFFCFIQFSCVHIYIYTCSTKWIYYCLCIHFTINGYLGCSHFLAIKNNAAMNILLHILWFTHAHISVRYMPIMELLEGLCNPILMDNANSFSKRLYWFVLPLGVYDCLYSTFWVILYIFSKILVIFEDV